ncbi:hypothetical protein GOP47_0026563 [Adiantum capillus-veneris]|nr:hypothetical protein GOP47_0026563 [Adiantum capillus-veneris]
MGGEAPGGAPGGPARQGGDLVGRASAVATSGGFSPGEVGFLVNSASGGVALLLVACMVEGVSAIEGLLRHINGCGAERLLSGGTSELSSGDGDCGPPSLLRWKLGTQQGPYALDGGSSKTTSSGKHHVMPTSKTMSTT